MTDNNSQMPTSQTSMLDMPEWVIDGKKIDEGSFCRDFLEQHPMICVHGSFFTEEGRVTDEEKLRREIYERITPYAVSGVARKVDNLLELLRVEAYVPDLPVKEDRIHIANGTYLLEDGFTEGKEHCRNRLPVAFNLVAKELARWKSFLADLLIPDDILTLQEFMGYCLIPTNCAQKMLMIVGSGGEGKSRIGVVMRALFGDNMVNGNLDKVETNRFARADLEHMLVMVDDDMKLEALPQTHHIKTIITAELPLDLEKKSKQSYQGELYCRFLGFGNGSIKALYDRSHRFFRRQIILTTRRRPTDCVDDPHLSEKLVAEKEGILLWCLNGLHRLIENSFQFTISQQTKDNMAEAISDGNNIVDFLRSEGYIEFQADAEISSKQLYSVYETWCEDNAHKLYSPRSFSQYLTEHQADYNLEATNNIRLPGGKRVRGFVGIRSLLPYFG